MSIIVNRSTLYSLIKKLTLENRSYHSANMAEVPEKDYETPIEPAEEMSLQLSTEKPPVADPEYSPTSLSSLAHAASAISEKVPSEQIEYFYQGLHRLLDLSIDKEDQKRYVQEGKILDMLARVLENKDPETEELDDESTDPEAEDLSNLPDREAQISRNVDNIVDMIIKSKIHLVELPGADVLDFESGEKRPMKVVASQGAVMYVLNRAFEKENISRAIEKAISELGISESIFITMVREDLLGYLGKDEKIDDALAAEMFSNIRIDKEMKAAEGNIEAFKALIHHYVTEGSEQLANKNPTDEFIFTLSELGTYKVTVEKMLELIEDAKQDAIAEIEGQPSAAEDVESGSEEGEERLSKAEVEAIRKMIRAETLASEYEPGKLNLSQEAIRAFIEKISEETGQSIGDVRNIFYEDLKASGMDNEVLRKVFGLRRMPRGRQSIPLIYDPLKVRAEEEVVAKLYDVFMHNLGVFLKDRIDAEDPIAQDLEAKLLGPDGLYQPGLEGYQRLQSVVGLPSEDTDIDSSKFRDTRSAYEAVQEFIDIMAKDHIVPEDIKAKGGLKMIIKDFEDNHDAFGTLDEREDFDEFIAGQTRMYDSFKRDTPRSQKRIFDVIGKALSKAPKRRDRYINKLKSER